jgi:hypothetical protein
VDEKQAQLEWEARAGRIAAVAAFLSAAGVVGAIAARASIGKSSTKKAESLRIAHDHAGAIIAYGVITALSFLALMVVLVYLYRATKFRRPELPRVAEITAILGPILLAIGGVVGVFLLKHAADTFLASGAQTEARAKHLSESGGISTMAGIGLAGSLATGISLAFISLNAGRAGLLSRFMAILGVIFGALLVIPIVPAPVIQLFWCIALGLLFLNRWPGERGPAWETGEAVEWPSGMQQRAEAMRQARDEEPEEAEPEEVEEVAETDSQPEPVSQRNPNARSRKRKKKGAGR